MQTDNTRAESPTREDDTLAQLANRLRIHNKWRRGDGDQPPTDPTQLGLDIDAAVEAIDRVAAQAAEIESLKSRADDDLPAAIRALTVEPCADPAYSAGFEHGVELAAKSAEQVVGALRAKLAEAEGVNKYLGEHHDATHDPAGQYWLLLDRLSGEPTNHGNCPVAARLSELEAVVSKLPVTADGVRVVPGDPVFIVRWPGEDTLVAADTLILEPETFDAYGLESCYSTHEAAASAARAAAEKGGGE